jgi:hypothetical protein
VSGDDAGSDASESMDGSGDGPSDAAMDGSNPSDAQGRCTGPTDCAGDGGTNVCDVDAATCVGCLADSDCIGSSHAVCDPNVKMCVGCLKTADCSGAAPVCDTAAKACVECLATSDCKSDPARPVCDTAHHVCVKCSTDTECAAKLGADPGVCLSHQDGRCAAAAETIFVENDPAKCSDVAGMTGRPDKPLCTMQAGAALLSTGTYDVIIVRGIVPAGTWTLASSAGEISIIGQKSGFLAASASPALSLTNGGLFVRDLQISASAAVGISATGGTLRLDDVTLSACLKGGILLGGAAFDIKNTLITGSGPGTQGSTTWGGLFVSVLPATGAKSLTRVTIRDNKQVGLTCVGSITGSGVFATGNVGGVDVNPSCEITPCPTEGPTCGAAMRPAAAP